MQQTQWLVEMLVPSGEIQTRPIVTERTTEQLSADIHASVADLLAYQPAPILSPQEPSPLLQQQQLPQLQRRMLLAHAAEPERARKLASDLQAMLRDTSLPWTPELRHRFDAYLLEAMQ